MTNEYERTNPQSVERRRFLKMSAKLGVGATMAGLCGEVLITGEAFAEAAKKESELKAAAEHTMILGTAYAPGVSRSYPIMQLNFKTNIQNASNGKIYVQLAPSGRVGSGSTLAREVQKATIHAGQCSFSNFSPFVPEVDLVNIPYWCSENQKFVNLVTSDIWKREIHPKIEARGFKPLWYPCIDPRTLALRKGIEAPVKTPDQLRGLKFRIPNSEMMLNVYRQLGANPIPIAWGESAVALKLGRADALDPAVGALYVFGFEGLLLLKTRLIDDGRAQTLGFREAFLDDGAGATGG